MSWSKTPVEADGIFAPPIPPASTRMGDIFGEKSSLFCSICKACTCPPGDELLISFLDVSNPFNPINDDDVAWLSRFYIAVRDIGQGASSPSTLPEVKYFMSGLCRLRRGKVLIQKGSSKH